MTRACTSRGRDGRSGFTLVEILIVMVIFGIIVTGAVGFLAVQSKAFYRGADKMTAMQNLRFALDQLETDVQTAGTNLPEGQPWMIHADEDVIAFNGDYASNVANDIGSVFYDPGAPNGAVTALRTLITVPNSAVSWGDTAYTGPNGIANSPAELIVLFFKPDTSTARADDYMLLRQVNHTTPQLVSRNLLRQGSQPFFRYFFKKDSTGAPSRMDSLPDTVLPLTHFTRLEGSVADTGSSALLDRFRGVRVQLRGTNGLTGPDERTADMTRLVKMRNAGVARLRSCGDEPILGTAGFAAMDVDTAGADAVLLSWNPATDETMGEQDVVRYTIWRRPSGVTVWQDPYLSIPAGATSYTYLDAGVTVGETYTYAIAAQDCTPKLSGMLQAAPVTVN